MFNPDLLEALTAFRKSEDVSSFNHDEFANKLVDQVQRDLGFDAVKSSPRCIEDLYDPKVYFCLRQSKELKKKYKSSTHDNVALEKAAYSKFLRNCATIENVNRCFPWPSIGTGVSRSNKTDRILHGARHLAQDIMGELTIPEWFRECKHGSGTSLGLKFEATSLEDKWTYPITVTVEALGVLERYFSWDTQLDAAIVEMNRFSDQPRYRIVTGSRATTVDKDDKTDRMIAIEPTGNMFLAQGLMRVLAKRLKRFGLDLSTLPDYHMLKALISSITGSDATVDWSSASDCVALKLIEFLSTSLWFGALMKVRSNTLELMGTTIRPPMYATMGNATTFPLETICFYAIAVACVAYVRSCPLQLLKHKKDVSVFGDDCILPTDCTSLFIEICSAVGFTINKEKSFIDPSVKFRESCGGDYLAGRNVRPYYLRAPHNDRLSSIEPWLYTIWNGLQTKYVSYFGPTNYVYASGALRLIAKTLFDRGLTVKSVPDYFPDDAGLKILDDYDRVRENILLKHQKISQVSKNRHGQLSFLYTAFQYKRDDLIHKLNYSEEVRYADALKAMDKQYKSEKDRCKARYLYDYRKLTDGSIMTPYSNRVLALALHWANKKDPDLAQRYMIKRIGGYVVRRFGVKPKRR